MKIQPEELADHHFTLLNSMAHHELIPFVKTYLSKRTFFSAACYLLQFISFGVLLFFFLKFHRINGMRAVQAFQYFMVGLSIAMCLIPLHEWIHVLAYKVMGAQHTSYDMNLKKFYFLAVAHRFVASRKEFMVVALAPVTIISLFLIMAVFFAGPNWSIAWLTTLMVHASFCSGDFALLVFFEVNSDKEAVTCDDKEKNISFFYGRPK